MLAESPETDGFRHEAFLYAGEKEFVAGASRFLREAVRTAEPTLVVVSSRKIDLLRKQLKVTPAKVVFADMADVGLNPALIIPAWTDFVNAHEGQRLEVSASPSGRSERQPSSSSASTTSPCSMWHSAEVAVSR